MDSTVILTVTRGPLVGQNFVFVEPTTCLIGRARDCTITLPQGIEYMDVSRHHCLVEITPPSLRVHDLGSTNGTYVNGKKIGQRATLGATGDMQASHQPAVALIDGDEIQLGEYMVFRVGTFTLEREERARTARRSSGELRFEELVHS